MHVIQALAAFVFASPVFALTLSGRALPTPISASTALSFVNSVPAKADSTSPAYDRARFGSGWATGSDGCDTRQTVLKRDGTSVTTDSSCNILSGHWVSIYDKVTITNSSALDIDHLVPLEDAWVSGAHSWTDTQRKAYANDLVRPQLIAVSASSNRSKGSRDPALYLPDASFVCTYVRAWVEVKRFYNLSFDTNERNALISHLNSCL